MSFGSVGAPASRKAAQYRLSAAEKVVVRHFLEMRGVPPHDPVSLIRTVSKARLADEIGSLGKDEAAGLRRVITEMYGE